MWVDRVQYMHCELIRTGDRAILYKLFYDTSIYGHSIQFNQEFACKAISELGIDQYQNYNNNVPHWLLKNIFAVLYVLFSVLALQPCINFKVYYINIS